MKSGRRSKKQCNRITYMIICGIQSYSLNCNPKEQDGSLHVRMYALVLALCSNVEVLCARAHFLRFFRSLLMKPTVATPSRRFQQELHFACMAYGYCRNHVGTMNGASGILGAEHGMAKRDAAGYPSKSVA